MDKKLLTIIALFGAASGAVAVFTYFEGKKKRKLQEEIFELDKQIKLLQLLDHQKSAVAY